MLGAAQAYALRPETPRPRGVFGGVGIGPHRHTARPVGVAHQPVDGCDQVVPGVDGAILEVADDRRVDHRHLAQEYFSGGAVDGDDVAFFDGHACGGAKNASLRVHLQLFGAADGCLAHAASNDRGMAGLAAAAGEDAAGGDHAVEIIGVGLAAHQDDVLARARPLHRGVGVKHDLAHRRARRGVHALRDLGPLGRLVEAREHQLRELGAGHPRHRLVEIDQTLVDQLGGDPERGRRGALADPRLQHPQLAALDRELDVAEVLVVLLERLHNLAQLVVGLLVDLLEIGQRHGIADASDDILALRVLQVVAVDALRAGTRGRG